MDFYESHAHLWNKDLLDEEVRQQTIKNATRVGISKGRKQGLLKGRKQNKIETAKAMLKKEFDIKDILEITGLSIEEINKLENN